MQLAARPFVLALLVLVATAIVGATETVGAAPVPTSDIVLLRDTTNEDGDWPAAGWRAPGALPGRPETGPWIDHGKHWGGNEVTTTTLQESTTQVAADGSGSFDIHWTATWNNTVDVDRCEIKNGTGVYKGIHGTGSWTLDFDSESPYLLIICSAKLRFDNRG